jgi:hypothetical protein
MSTVLLEALLVFSLLLRRSEACLGTKWDVYQPKAAKRLLPLQQVRQGHVRVYTSLRSAQVHKAWPPCRDDASERCYCKRENAADGTPKLTWDAGQLPKLCNGVAERFKRTPMPEGLLCMLYVPHVPSVPTPPDCSQHMCKAVPHALEGCVYNINNR